MAASGKQSGIAVRFTKREAMALHRIGAAEETYRRAYFSRSAAAKAALAKVTAALRAGLEVQ